MYGFVIGMICGGWRMLGKTVNGRDEKLLFDGERFVVFIEYYNIFGSNMKLVNKIRRIIIS